MLKFLASSLLLSFVLASESSSESSSSESTSSESSSSESTITTTKAGTTTTTTSSGTTTTKDVLRDNLVCNYYYTAFDSSHFAFAIGQCTTYSIIQGLYMNATCLNSSALEVKRYAASGCKGTPSSTNTYSSDQANFHCGGSGYANFSVSVSGCPATYVVYAAINTCTNASASIWSSVYCTDTAGEIQYYTASTCSNSSFYSLQKFNQTCGYLFTTKVGDIVVKGSLNTCNLGTSTATTTTPSPTISDANAHYANTIVFCIFMLVVVLLF
jgi:hypothetical protein